MLALFSTEWPDVAHPRFRDAALTRACADRRRGERFSKRMQKGQIGIDRAEAERQRDCVKASADVDRRKR
jgi:hypothetical protein